MPRLTPRQQLTERVAERLHERGFNDQAAYATAVLAVDAWYGRNEDSEFHALVCHEALASVVNVIPAFAANMRAAFQQAMTNATALTQAMSPWLELAERLEEKGPRRPTEFDASGLPIREGNLAPVVPLAAERQGEPCIEEGCGATAVPGTAFCTDCMPTPSTSDRLMAIVRDSITGDTSEHEVPPELLEEATLVDNGRRSVHLQPFQRPEEMDPDAPAPMFQMGVFTDVAVQTPDGQWESLPGITSVEANDPLPEVIYLTSREWHLSAARGLRKLGCTYAELKDMHDRGDFATARHHSLWFNIGGIVDREQLDRAEFVLRGLECEDGEPAMVDLSDQEIEELEQDYPTDRITGAPHHYIINGDHTACGCNGHDPSCEVWEDSNWVHKPTLCRIVRTNCNHYNPRHTYGQMCAHDVRPPVVGRTTEGEDVRGPAAG